jgi:YVTN family beta-propeller protein
MKRITAVAATLLLSIVIINAAAEDQPRLGYAIYVTNERSGDVSVIDAETNQVTATIPAGKRPRGIHCSPDGRRVYVALSGSPRMAPGVDRERAELPPADKAADGIGVIDPLAGRLIEKIDAGSDPEEFALSKDGTRLFIGGRGHRVDPGSHLWQDCRGSESC